MFKITYNYDTGNSYSIDTGVEDSLEAVFKTEQCARENVQRIVEHYKQYCEINENKSKINQYHILKLNKDKDWFVYKAKLFAKIPGKEVINGYIGGYDQAIDEEDKHKYKDTFYLPDEFLGQYCIKLYTDDQKEIQISCPWCGYFETLNFLRIDLVDNIITL